MKCPICKKGNLVPSFLEGLFRAHTCDDCGGNWLLIEDYVAWKERHPEHAFVQEDAFEADDSKQALICPMTGTLMHKYKISNSSDHRLDYSPSVGGVLLDKGEWQYLKEQKLAGSLNKIFTAEWQRSLREQNAEMTFADIYRERFGDESYEKIKEIRAWLNDHPRRADLRAYLLAEDPYSVNR
ncbi:zf-TFIIB domain-containing protein [Amphritea sp.]|uniref:TFIIB-type zinc ribbon-containing protein n=1 Tax=Amphritea sp. TaxID=1872502 RepID=UPI003D0BBD47